jgi:hypothetical protein
MSTTNLKDWCKWIYIFGLQSDSFFDKMGHGEWCEIKKESGGGGAGAAGWNSFHVWTGWFLAVSVELCNLRNINGTWRH